MRLDGKVALVTGGTRGIGRGIVQMLAAQGAGVAFTGRSEANGREVERLVAEAGGQAMFVRADNSVESDIAHAVRATVDRFGSLTTLVNNAISDDTGSGRDNHIDEIDDETIHNIMTVAVMGTFWACRHAIPEMRKAGNGSIVNISASSSKKALPHRPAYHASKGAINALTRQLAADYGAEDIRTNTIIVGFIYTGTEIMDAILADERNVAAGVVYLASDEAKYVTGIELTIDGGALCRQALPEFHYEEVVAAREDGAGGGAAAAGGGAQ